MDNSNDKRKEDSFLTEEDYRTVCDDFEFRQVTAGDMERRAAETVAIGQVSAYARGRYDMLRAYAARGADRDPMLVQCTVNITLYLMIHRLPQNMGHERRVCLYDETIKWLRDVQNGKASPDWPTYAGPGGETDSHNPVRFGSMPRNTYDW